MLDREDYEIIMNGLDAIVKYNGIKTAGKVFEVAHKVSKMANEQASKDIGKEDKANPPKNA